MLVLVFIHPMCRLDQVSLNTVLFGEGNVSVNIARKTRAPKAQPTLKIIR